jgi:hypothetical protein
VVDVASATPTLGTLNTSRTPPVTFPPILKHSSRIRDREHLATRGIAMMPNELAKDSIPPSVAAFITYKRYLQHLELALTKTYGTKPALGRAVGKAVHSLPAVRRIRQRSLEPKLRDAVARELGMAWNEEISIRVLSEIDPTKLPWLLPNAAVNSYFAIYHGARAWIAASGQPQRDTHAQVLHALGDAAAQRLCQRRPKTDSGSHLVMPRSWASEALREPVLPPSPDGIDCGVEHPCCGDDPDTDHSVCALG